MTSRREFLRSASVLAAGAAIGCREATEPRVLVPLPRAPGGRLSVTHAAPQQSIATGLRPLNLGASRDGQLFVPSTYSPAKPIPLVVLFHGFGGASGNWFGSYDDRGEAAGYAMLAIDSRLADWDLNLAGYGSDLTFLNQALAFTFDRVAIDPDRMAVAGFSAGAAYALGIGLTNGDFFSKVIAYTPVDMSGIDAHGTPRVFVSHGTRDGTAPPELSSRQFVGQLRAAGYDVEFIQFDGGHLVPQRISDHAFEWLAKSW